MDKIAFVVHRYGKDINGGAEVHVRMIAERISSYYDVDVITTTIKQFGDDEQDYPEGQSTLNGVNILRFKQQQDNSDKYRQLRRRSKVGRKIRRKLYRIGLLRSLTNRFYVCGSYADREREFFEAYPSHSPELVDYIRDNKDKYKAYIFITYYFPHTSIGALVAPEKSIVIPTAHNESALFFAYYEKLFSKVGYVAFNAPAEQRLCENIFGNKIAEHGVVATGIELKPSLPWEEVKSKYNLPDRYVLYLGRVSKGKINTLQSDFLKFRKRYNSDVKLVMTGGIDGNVTKIDDPNIIFTGFVDEGEKSAIIENAIVMVNPSKYESLSLLVLEALSSGVPVLVNGRCEVLKDHCSLSGGACRYYIKKRGFGRELNKMLMDEPLRKEMIQRGREYVDNNYSWRVIIDKFRGIIESI